MFARNETQKSYSFSYDNLNRLTKTEYTQAWPAYASFTAETYNYDKHGNILKLKRSGKINDGPSLPNSLKYGIIDDLTLSYDGNQLSNVEDVAPNDPLYNGIMHFTEETHKDVEYTYDKNGNMISDQNKGISSISYNLLNLPQSINFQEGYRTENLYDATGRKLQVKYLVKSFNNISPEPILKDSTWSSVSDSLPSFVERPRNPIPGQNPIGLASMFSLTFPGSGWATNPSVVQQYAIKSTIDYCGNIIYKDGKIDKILTQEGYADKNENGIFVLHYYLKDHQGNNRVVLNQDGMIEQVNHYYPFGGIFREDGYYDHASDQRYMYNGKELDRMYGLDLYDYHKRMQDPALGRFTTIDPMAEKYYNISPYAYCGNNPITRIDVNGKEWDYVVGSNGHITINVQLNFSTIGNHTNEQINAYKAAIAAQFHNTIFESSGGSMSGNIIFHNNNEEIIQSLTLDKLNGNIGGMTSHFSSSVNLYNPVGELRPLFDIGSDATHEILHTLRLAHPFEITQSPDTKLIRVAPNSFISSFTTDKNIINNVMNYPMITIDGMRSNNQTSLTKGQLNFMLNEIKLQKQGYGFIPKYNPNTTPEQNFNLYKKYYENYWLNTPGVPVTDK